MKTQGATRILLSFVLLLGARSVAASWPVDPTVNVPVCALPSNQGNPGIASDGADGAIVLWGDNRSSSVDQYALRIQANGEADPTWTTNGQVLSTAPFEQFNDFHPQRNYMIVSDGAGGAFVCWQDKRKGTADVDIYAQHILSTGIVDPFWPPDGCAVSVANGRKEYPVIAADGVGGAFIAWQDPRDDEHFDLYAQHVLSTGTVDTRWPADGLPVAVAPHQQVTARIVPDGSGGAIVCWEDRRSISSIDVYGQRLTAAGVPQWAANGIPLWTDPGDARSLAILADGAGGAIVTWSTHLNPGTDIYAQRVDHDGQILWGAQGAPVCTESTSQYDPVIAPDGSGGAIIAWDEGYILAQRIAGNGTRQWQSEGVLLSSVPNNSTFPTIVSDGIGGAIVGWQDTRNEVETDPDVEDVDLYAQHVLSNGVVDPLWPTDGRAICTAFNAQYHHVAVMDGSGGAIFAWMDDRANGSDVYAQRVDYAGRLGGSSVSVPGTTTSPLSIEASPNPGPRGRVTLSFVLPSSAEARLEGFDTAGRRVAGFSRTIRGAGRHQEVLSSRDLAPGVYMLRLSQGADSRTRRVVVLE